VIVNHDIGAFVRQAHCDDPADALGSTSDQRDPPL